MFQVYPVSSHHCTCHCMNQSLVRQKADSRATVTGHFCSLQPDYQEESKPKGGDSWSLVFVVGVGTFMRTR